MELTKVPEGKVPFRFALQARGQGRNLIRTTTVEWDWNDLDDWPGLVQSTDVTTPDHGVVPNTTSIQ